MLPTIDIEATGLEQYDLELITATVPNFKFGDNSTIKADIKKLNTDAIESKENIKKLKKSINEGVKTDHQQTHFTITFKDYNAKAEYLESIGINGDTILLTSERFFKAIETE